MALLSAQALAGLGEIANQIERQKIRLVDHFMKRKRTLIVEVWPEYCVGPPNAEAPRS
jgi:hypothetical protein